MNKDNLNRGPEANDQPSTLRQFANAVGALLLTIFLIAIIMLAVGAS